MILAIVKTNIQQFDHHLCRIFFLQEFLLSISPDLLHMKVKWQQIKAVCRMSKNLQRVLSLVLTIFKDCSMKYYVQNKLQHRHSSCDSKYLKDIFFLGKKLYNGALSSFGRIYPCLSQKGNNCIGTFLLGK